MMETSQYEHRKMAHVDNCGGYKIIHLDNKKKKGDYFLKD